jgi:uncharacterized protein YndB with AHSA1/START domain
VSAYGDEARVSVRVEVPRAEAFRVFTEEIDQWWRRGLAYRVSGKGRGVLVLEPRVGGRLYESVLSKSGTKLFDSGEVRVWQPPERLVFSWRAVNFAPDEETEVEVTFTAQRASTLVTVVHRGWSKLRLDHPVRHGQPVEQFIREHGLWWGQLLTSLRHCCEPPKAS